MSTAWKGLYQVSPSHRTKGSNTGASYGVTDKDADVLHLCDTVVLNDLKEEFYYSVNDVATDAFSSHLKVLQRNPKHYVEIINTLRPVMLEAHKTIAALYLWTRNIDRQLAVDLLNEVRPSWKLTFFQALENTPPYAQINGAWNRSTRRLVNTLIGNADYYFFMKYAEKLRPVIAKAHVPENDKTQWLFKKNKRGYKGRFMEVPVYADYFKLVNAVKSHDRDRIINTLHSSRLPYTIALGILGSYTTQADVAEQLIHLMSPWELILGLRKLENTGVWDNVSSDTLNLIAKKVTPAKLQQMKVDPIELFQAYNKVNHPALKSGIEDLINRQVGAIGESIKNKIGDLKVSVVFDVSGSMEQVAEWSLMLACAIGSCSKNANYIAFSYHPHKVTINDTPLKTMAYIKQIWGQITGGTNLGEALIGALNDNPDIIFFISDFEGNIPPWSDQVYKTYKEMYGTFPAIVSIKATASPWTATGEYTALRTGRWLGIPEEFAFTIRNLWDMPTILEYLFSLLPLLKKKGILKESYAAS